MACVDMYNSDKHKPGRGYYPPVSPRISFSNDFVETTNPEARNPMRLRPAEPPSQGTSDFEFSVTNHSMMSADELFFKGKLLPFRGSSSGQVQRTLRQELLVAEDGYGGGGNDGGESSALRPVKGSSTRWKGFLGLRKAHIGSKKSQRSEERSGGQSYVDKQSQEQMGGAGECGSCSEEGDGI